MEHGTGKVRRIIDADGAVLAVIYLMNDGWHIKHDNRHDRHAWEGPYATAQDAADSFEPISATGAIPGITR